MFLFKFQDCTCGTVRFFIYFPRKEWWNYCMGINKIVTMRNSLWNFIPRFGKALAQALIVFTLQASRWPLSILKMWTGVLIHMNMIICYECDMVHWFSRLEFIYVTICRNFSIKNNDPQYPEIFTLHQKYKMQKLDLKAPIYCKKVCLHWGIYTK